jgi:NhaP-type Na+/H+ or K+/H+ antiporter
MEGRRHEPSSLLVTASFGGIAAMLAAAAYHILSEHSQRPYAELIPYFVRCMILSGLIGAGLSLLSVTIVRRYSNANRSDAT